LEAREAFREKVYAGISGNFAEIDAAYFSDCLSRINAEIKGALIRSREENGGLFPTFSPYEITSGGGAFDARNLVRVKKKLPRFLEGNAKGIKMEGFCDPRAVYKAVRESGIFDETLKVYKTSESIEAESPLIGRVRTFSPGLYERESCFLHMHYKYLLALLESGLYDEFYQSAREGLVCYMDPSVYGRSVLQNSSFIVSGVAEDKKLVGRGFQPRLTGANAEVIGMVIGMFLGRKLFYLDKGELVFAFEPKLHSRLFDGGGRASVTAFENTTVTYINPGRIDTYAPGAYIAKIEPDDGRTKRIVDGGVLRGADASLLRSGAFRSVSVYIAN
jgi:hypothetical protein